MPISKIMRGITVIKIPFLPPEEREAAVAARRQRVKFVFENESRSPSAIARTLGVEAHQVATDLKALGLKKPKLA